MIWDSSLSTVDKTGCKSADFSGTDEIDKLELMGFMVSRSATLI